MNDEEFKLFKQSQEQFGYLNTNNRHLQFIDTTIHPGLQGSWFDYLYGSGKWNVNGSTGSAADWWFHWTEDTSGLSMDGLDDLSGGISGEWAKWKDGPYTIYPWENTSSVYFEHPKPQVIYKPPSVSWIKSIRTEMRP